MIDSQQSLQTAEKGNTYRLPFTLTFHPHNHAVKYIIFKNFEVLQNNSDWYYLSATSTSLIQTWQKHRQLLGQKPTNNQPGTFQCACSVCKTCLFIHNVEKMMGPKWSVKITHHFTCSSASVIYCVTYTYWKKGHTLVTDAENTFAT